MSVTFDIFQGVGVAAACGIRPFLPGLATSLLAAGDVELSFHHTSYSFLQASPFLIVMIAGALALLLVERSPVGEQLRTGPYAVLVLLASCLVGGFVFAGELCRAHHAIWIGWVAGVLCAGVGIAASRPFLERMRRRLGDVAGFGLPLIGEGSALLMAVLSIVAPPLGVVFLLLLLGLLLRGRRRDDQKYAGLRILR